jgi:hypothetical protein
MALSRAVSLVWLGLFITAMIYARDPGDAYELKDGGGVGGVRCIRLANGIPGAVSGKDDRRK